MLDKDIIKGLEFCTKDKYSCIGCPYNTIDLRVAPHHCSYYLKVDALKLIREQQTLAESWKRLYEQTCAELRELLKLEKEIKEEAIKEFVEELKKITVPIMIGNQCRKVISEQGIDAVAKRMGADI